MQTPAQAARQRSDGGGTRLPMPWSELNTLKAHLRRGQLAMIVAAPGVGKSIVSLAYAVQSGVKTLYFSMDTDAFTTSARLVAQVAQRSMSDSELALVNGDQWALDAVSDPSLSNLSLAFPSNPQAKELVQRLSAYREARGEFPELVVVDNLQNVQVGEDEFGGQYALMGELQAIANQTGSCVLVLHHATGEHENGDAVLPQSGIRGKLSKFPSLILTLHNATGGYQRLGVSVVKNRFGTADPAGHGALISLKADKEKATISDYDWSYMEHMS